MDIEEQKSSATLAHERELANSKSLTIEPLHADITPENPDSFELAAERSRGSVIANAPNDIENTVVPEQSVVTPVKTHKPKKAHIVSGIVVGLGLVVGVMIFIH